MQILKKGGYVPKKEPNCNKLFAALKLIEQLNHDGHLPAYIFKNILNEYSDKIDISEFTIQEVEKKGE